MNDKFLFDEVSNKDLSNRDFSKGDFSKDFSELDNLDKIDFNEKLLISETTMPGFFISMMIKSGKPLSENQLYDCVLPRINDLRKPDGSKYKDNIKKVVKSTLCSSGIFEKVDNENKLWYFKKEDALHYINRTVEKTMSKKLEKNKRTYDELDESVDKNRIEKASGGLNLNPEIKSECVDQNLPQHNFLKKKLKRSLRNYNLKFIKANNILGELLSKYKNNTEVRKKFKNPFNNCNSALDLIKKLHGDENKIFGMLTAYKFFRPLSK